MARGLGSIFYALSLLGASVIAVGPASSDQYPCSDIEPCLPHCDWIADAEYIYCTYGAGSVLTIPVPSLGADDVESLLAMYPECASDAFTPTIWEVYNLTRPNPNDMPGGCKPVPYIEGYQTDRDGNFATGPDACDGETCYYVERGHATAIYANAPYDLVCVPGTTTPGVAPFVLSACLGKGWPTHTVRPRHVMSGGCDRIELAQGAYILNRVTGGRFPESGPAYDRTEIHISNGGKCS